MNGNAIYFRRKLGLLLLWFFAAWLVPLTVAGLIYLLGSFTAATFDISKWTEDSRGVAGFFILCGTFFGYVLTGVAIDDILKRS